MTIPINEAFERVVKKRDGDRRIVKQQQLQRRNTVTDAKADFKTMLRGKGVLYTGFGITKDMQFIMRYSFNLHIRPFVTTLSQNVTTGDQELMIEKTGEDTYKIVPNPHNHEVKLGIEISEHEFDNKSLRLKINGVDLTDAIIEEYGSFIDGYGYFPSEEGAYDVLRLVEHLAPWEQAEVLGAGRKEIQLTQDEQSLCECEISYYVKYNHVDRGGLVD